MKRKQALDFINTLSTKQQALQPLLRKFARGEKVSEEELKVAEDSDSRAGAVVAVLRDINAGKKDESVIVAIGELDSFGAPLQPLLTALAAGLTN